MSESRLPYRPLRDLLDLGQSSINLQAQSAGHGNILKEVNAAEKKPEKKEEKKPESIFATDKPVHGRIMELVHDGRRVTILASTDPDKKTKEERFEVVDNRGVKMVASSRQLRRIHR